MVYSIWRIPTAFTRFSLCRRYSITPRPESQLAYPETGRTEALLLSRASLNNTPPRWTVSLPTRPSPSARTASRHVTFGLSAALLLNHLVTRSATCHRQRDCLPGRCPSEPGRTAGPGRSFRRSAPSDRSQSSPPVRRQSGIHQPWR